MNLEPLLLQNIEELERWFRNKLPALGRSASTSRELSNATHDFECLHYACVVRCRELSLCKESREESFVHKRVYTFELFRLSRLLHVLEDNTTVFE